MKVEINCIVLIDSCIVLYCIVFTRVASHLARSDTTCVVARLSRSDPPHYYDTPPTNGKAPRAPLASDASPPAGLAREVSWHAYLKLKKI